MWTNFRDATGADSGSGSAAAHSAGPPLNPGERAELVLAGLRNLDAVRPGHLVGGCSWCGGSGGWTDPDTGECIQCGGGKTGSDDFTRSAALNDGTVYLPRIVGSTHG